MCRLCDYVTMWLCDYVRFSTNGWEWISLNLACDHYDTICNICTVPCQAKPSQAMSCHAMQERCHVTQHRLAPLTLPLVIVVVIQVHIFKKQLNRNHCCIKSSIFFLSFFLVDFFFSWLPFIKLVSNRRNEAGLVVFALKRGHIHATNWWKFLDKRTPYFALLSNMDDSRSFNDNSSHFYRNLYRQLCYAP